MTVFFNLINDAKLPEYKTNGASGADICSTIYAEIEPDNIAIVPTGLLPEIPKGYEIQIRPRSGLAAKYGITVLNTPGTIDSDYRGEIKVMLINMGKDKFIINKGERIAQIVVSPVIQAEFINKVELSKTERGAGGFGSTGVE
jgi:dUTP pyrophosphatase